MKYWSEEIKGERDWNFATQRASVEIKPKIVKSPRKIQRTVLIIACSIGKEESHDS